MADPEGLSATGPRVVVLDYGSGNLRSAERALAHAGARVVVTDDLAAAAAADGLVVPGVGAYAACMAGIDDLGAGPVIAARVRDGLPVLGICVGMQILFEYGDEHGVVTKGLGLFPGGVTRIVGPVPIPHMGWNTISAAADSVLFAGAQAGARYYFVHSYAARAEPSREAGVRVSTTEHGMEFVAAVERGPLAATQFHPEKSGEAGAAVLGNWLATLSVSA